MPEAVDWLPLAAFACVLCMAGVRAVVLRTGGIRVAAVDPQRSRAEKATDLLLPLLLLAWIGAAAAYAGELAWRLGPAWLHGRLWDAMPVRALGTVLLGVAVALYAVALRAFGRSWRLGIDREKPGPLATGGVLAWSRNPLFLAFDLLLTGTFLVAGRPPFLLLGIAVAAVLHAQILREERFLSSAYGEAYEDYRARVGRYLGRGQAQR